MRLDLPELSPSKTSSVRIPHELDVPVSARVRKIIDTPAFQRLKRISQLGLVQHVYPGASHTRFEHSLGVYRLACLVLESLTARDSEIAAAIDEQSASTFLLSALLHDVGHWPYCHPIEDLQFDWVPSHESLARKLICSGEIADAIQRDWDVSPDAVAGFLEHGAADGNERGYDVLRNLLNGPVDIDKMDYLQRDSLHAGVPYGRNFDIGRLVGSLCIGADGRSIAITQKGKTAAEMMVFARYVMFSEVYWHHTVRSATAMLQRVVFENSGATQPEDWLGFSDHEFGQSMLRASSGSGAIEHLSAALFGNQRQLYKRLAQFSFGESSSVHAALAGRPYHELVAVADRLAARLSSAAGVNLQPGELLIDAPPVKLEVQFKIDVRSLQDGSVEFVPLSQVSPVVNALATKQFDNYVKRVRVFVAPQHRSELKNGDSNIGNLLEEVVQGEE